MATYYVSDTGSNTSPYDTWAKAANLLQTALTAASSGTDVILVDKDHTGDNNIASDLTLTCANHVSVICVDKDAADALATMGETTWIGNAGTTRRVFLAGGYRFYCYGLTFRMHGSSAFEISLCNTVNQETILENCKVWLSGTAASFVSFSENNAVQENSATMIGGEIKLAAAGQQIRKGGGRVELKGVSVTGTAPTTLFNDQVAFGVVYASGCDFSTCTGTLVGAMINGGAQYYFSNCKLGTGVTMMATQSNFVLSACEVFAYNCSSADQNYHIGHYNVYGSTVCETSIYADDGALYDGTNHVTWKIVTTNKANYYSPYNSPWIDWYHSGTSAITPYLEILRDGSATAFQDDEVWGEFSYQGTTGFPIAVFTSDRMTLLGTPADQTAGVGVAGWTGENATAWSGKLVSSSITPAEIGHLRARVCVGEPSTTVYVDPTIRL